MAPEQYINETHNVVTYTTVTSAHEQMNHTLKSCLHHVTALEYPLR